MSGASVSGTGEPAGPALLSSIPPLAQRNSGPFRAVIRRDTKSRDELDRYTVTLERFDPSIPWYEIRCTFALGELGHALRAIHKLSESIPEVAAALDVTIPPHRTPASRGRTR